MALAPPTYRSGRGSSYSPKKAQPGGPAFTAAGAQGQFANALPSVAGGLYGGYNWQTGMTPAGQAQMTGYQGQLLGSGAQRDWGSRWMNTEYGVDRRLLDLDVYGNKIDQAAAARTLAPGGLFDVRQGDINTRRQLLARELANQMRGFDIDYTEAGQQGRRNVRQRTSEATVRGSLQAPGTREAMQDIYRDLYNTIGRIDVGREGARIGNERSVSGLGVEEAGLKEDRAQTRDRQAKLNLEAQRLGISGEQLRNNLNKGLEKLGIDYAMNVNDVITAMNSTSAEERAKGEQIYRMALGYSSYFPRG
jgi:hypothetical protein